MNHCILFMPGLCLWLVTCSEKMGEDPLRPSLQTRITRVWGRVRGSGGWSGGQWLRRMMRKLSK